MTAAKRWSFCLGLYAIIFYTVQSYDSMVNCLQNIHIINVVAHHTGQQLFFCEYRYIYISVAPLKTQYFSSN